MRNYPEWALSYWATISIGAAAVGVNAWWTPAELEYGLGDSRPKVVICDGERLDRLNEIIDGLREAGPMHVISVRTEGPLPAEHAVRWDDVIDPANAPTELPAAEIDADDDMCIFYTSGTTGFPKEPADPPRIGAQPDAHGVRQRRGWGRRPDGRCLRRGRD